MSDAPPRRLFLGEGLIALAFVGAHLAFMPLFVLLLPRRAALVAPDDPVQLLSILLLVGGVTASMAHVVAGAISDRWIARTGSRRGVIAIGAATLGAAYVALAHAYSAMSLGASLVVFQMALNLMFAPLGALLADHIENRRKGRVAALMNVALPLSGAGTAVLAFAFPQDSSLAFLAIAAVSLAAVCPLMLVWPLDRIERGADAPAASGALAMRDYALVWGARLLMQSGAAFLFSFFYLFLAAQSAASPAPASRALGMLTAAATLAAVTSALAAGLWSDRLRRRRGLMIAAAVASAIAFALLSRGTDLWVWMAGYVLFNAGLTTFLSIDSALVAQLVAGNRRRGELLGYMNLTNTIPAILVPALTLTALGDSPQLDWSLSFMVAALVALAAAVLIAPVRAIR